MHEPIRVDVHTRTGQRAANGTNAVNKSGARDDAAAVGHLAGQDGRQTGCCRDALDVARLLLTWRRFAASGRDSRRSDRADGSTSRRFPRRGSRNRTPARSPGVAIRSLVRCRQASTTSRACAGSNSAKDPVWLAGKADHLAAAMPRADTKPSPAGAGVSSPGPDRLANRFSKTTTS